MSAVNEVLDQFVKAFNEKNLDGLENLLAPDATAKVLGTDWPEEKGASEIRKISLELMLGDGEDPLIAEHWTDGSQSYILLREPKGGCRMDSAIRMVFKEGATDRIQRLEYLITGQQDKALAAIGDKKGIKLRAVSEQDMTDK